ncbi:hypothetical protein [Rosistilla oblonga]|uniref:hypothetical protein n=1 Tax=Rosistilla oblonga TaxID=2527990 RepID=UPI003A973033
MPTEDKQTVMAPLIIFSDVDKFDRVEMRSIEVSRRVKSLLTGIDDNAGQPSDDDEPVDENWLKSVGFNQRRHGWHGVWFRDTDLRICNFGMHGNNHWGFTYGQHRIGYKAIKNRGQVRAMAKALAIELDNPEVSDDETV